jgi:hypothetical protein
LPRRLFRLRAVALVVAAPLAVAGLSHTALAGGHTRLSISGPATLTRAATYHVRVSGGGQVCRVQETTTEQALTRRTATSYDLPVTLTSLAGGHHTLVVQAYGCHDRLLGSAKLDVFEPVHVNVASRWVAPAATDAEYHRLAVSVTTVDRAATARIVRKGRTVATLRPARGYTTRWAWTPPAGAPAGDYTVAVTAAGRTATFGTTITKGWAPLSPPFPHCQTLTWTYSSAHQPARASGMATDVATAFTRVGRATGITFRPAARGGTIQLGWKDLGRGGADGEGGATWSGDTAESGKIEFNTQSQWVALPGFAGAEGGLPGRGAMITHEIGHALGLGHVSDPHQVMYPVATNGSPAGLAAGDLAGLKALYRTSSC